MELGESKFRTRRLPSVCKSATASWTGFMKLVAFLIAENNMLSFQHTATLHRAKAVFHSYSARQVSGSRLRALSGRVTVTLQSTTRLWRCMGFNPKP